MLRDNPGGITPDDCHEYGPVPPVAENDTPYIVPTFGFDIVEGVIVIVGRATVTV